MKYMIDNKAFKSKKCVTDFVREIVKQYENNEFISEEHTRFMIALLEHHQYRDQKIGCGVERMWIEQNAIYPSKRGFWLERTDGTKTDFSFIKCLSSRMPVGTRSAHPCTSLNVISSAIRRLAHAH